MNKGVSIRGCDVHYKRGVKKVAEKVAVDVPSNNLFRKIAHAIPVSKSLVNWCKVYVCYTKSVFHS